MYGCTADGLSWHFSVFCADTQLAGLSRQCEPSLVTTNHNADLGRLDPAFAGFKLYDGCIVLPNGYRYTPGYLYAISIRMQQIAELERERRTPKQLLL